MNTRKFVVVAASAALALGMGMAGPAAFAAAGGTGHTVTQTFHQHGTWVEPGDTDFCTGQTIAPTITGNEVSHVTYFTGSDEAWGTFTETGRATAVINGLTWSGKITIWGNFNVNQKNHNNTFTATFKLSATDPQSGAVYTEIGHETMHMGWNAVSDQPVVSFDKMWLTCNIPS
ncbi:hypothetical protein [Microbacterium rhizosphaerae]|uniref:Secreted protein n=1 Tax=Microbacterium rhizosphaerae TaxID=1678237 RepID=A0ABZ0SSB8_9MICO|nr:hypothetical protein [Microbacterium rhizosphaerae]WPR91144.1 hypothetical protein SM116_07610 [Microbacterium rhizosphaerae]